MFGKKFYLSLTFWGLIIYGISDALNWLCGQGILPTPICTTVAGLMGPIGTIMAFLGIRRAKK